MTKLAYLISFIILMTFTSKSMAERDNTYNPGFCDNSRQSCETEKEFNCEIPGGEGYNSALGMAVGSSFPGKGMASFCAVEVCDAGFTKKGALCLPNISVRKCTVPNGKGLQDRYASRWSACDADSCKSGFKLVRGVCVKQQTQKIALASKAKKAAKPAPVKVGKSCQIKNGKGNWFDITSKQGFCQISTCNKGFAKKGNTCVVSSAPTVKVNLVVLRDSNGAGNGKWNMVYINRMVDQLTEQTLGNVKFTLGRVTYINNSNDYHNKKQDSIKYNYIQFREFGAITGIVSGHGTTDSRGTAMGIKYNFEPIFVFRSWYNDGSDKDSLWAAKVFLHELGHNMGMKHDYYRSVNMDTHYYKSPGIIRDYARNLTACKTPSVACVAKYAKFGNYLNIERND